MQDVPDVSSEEELLKLREERKISEDEYKDLLASIRRSRPSETETPEQSNSYASDSNVQSTERQIPGTLWIALISLSAMVLLKVLFAFKVGPVILIDAALSGALLVGLYLGHKWAYVLTIVFVAFGTVSGLSKSVGHGLTILIVDCLVLVPVLMCTEFFFPKMNQINKQ